MDTKAQCTGMPTSKLNDDAKFRSPLVHRISKEKNVGISNPMESAP
jgi:hypothetical protein